MPNIFPSSNFISLFIFLLFKFAFSLDSCFQIPGVPIQGVTSPNHNPLRRCCRCGVLRLEIYEESFEVCFSLAENCTKMIKIITTIVCGISAMLMLIVSMATNYWLQWMVATSGLNITHFRGLGKMQCWEAVHNETGAYVEKASDCDNWYESMPGKFQITKC